MKMAGRKFFLPTRIIVVLIVGCFGQEKKLSLNIGDAPAGASTTFLVTCEEKCKDVNATIEVDSGDPDLYASEEQPPQIGWKEF